MAILSTSNPWAFTFGLLGNIISFVVFLAPLPTFIRIYKKKSTQGFDSLPYLVTLFSAMLWIYYASQKSDIFLLITINGFGCVIETVYIALYIAYAPKQPRMYTLRILFLMNFLAFSVILLLTYLFTKGSLRAEILGWICVAFSTCVFASPLSVMRQVIRTKSVEFMPFSLSFALTISAVVWLVYGISLKDLYVALPNILGFIFGVAQMILYAIYKNNKTTIVEEKKMPQENVDGINLNEIVIGEIKTGDSTQPRCSEEAENKDINVCQPTIVAEKNHIIVPAAQVIECAA